MLTLGAAMAPKVRAVGETSVSVVERAVRVGELSVGVGDPSNIPAG